jgi:SAM-dependent methyltransferase
MIFNRVIAALIQRGTISTQDRVLVVCGGELDRNVLFGAGFENVTISNLDPRYVPSLAPYEWSHQDAERLTYADESFDVVIVHAGLHHCHSPHRGLLEMYRVARKAVVVFEARDSLALNVAMRLGLTTDYEIEGVSGEGFASGGVGNGPIPNFIYRWTEKEVLKTIQSYEPRYKPRVQFFYGLALPYQRLRSTQRPWMRVALFAIVPIAEAVGRLFPRQGNEFAFAITKGGELHAWLTDDAGAVVVSQEAVRAMGRNYKRR